MINVKGKNVYLSGPMTGIENYNAAAFAEAHAMLKLAGAEYVHDPALEWLRNDGDERTHAYWIRRGLRNLALEGEGRPLYDILVSLPGWQDSEGASLERTVARACGIEVCELADVVGGEAK